MRRPEHQIAHGEELFIGIDLHKQRWHVTIRTREVELFSASIPGKWESLQRILDRYSGHSLQAVYEAGYFGFRLHDRLVERGIPCIVTPPSLVPQEYGNRVKTDRRDSRKLAQLLAKGLLKRVWVPSEEELYTVRSSAGAGNSSEIGCGLRAVLRPN
jgi:transposase